MVVFTQRSCWILVFVWMLAGCLQTGLSDFSSTSSVVALGPSPDLHMRPVANNVAGASISLWQRHDGTTAVRTVSGSASLLHGLDPLQLDPSVLPFLFPSCNVSLAH